MQKTSITAILLLIFSFAYAQHFKEVARDSITDIEFAEHFFEIDLPDNFELKVNNYGFWNTPWTYTYERNIKKLKQYASARSSLNITHAVTDIVMKQDTSINISVDSSLPQITGRLENVPDSSYYARYINISYYVEKNDWFVVSGVDEHSGELVYIKFSNGDIYNSIIRFQYPREKKTLIEPYISRLSKSFKSH